MLALLSAQNEIAPQLVMPPNRGGWGLGGTNGGHPLELEGLRDGRVDLSQHCVVDQSGRRARRCAPVAVLHVHLMPVVGVVGGVLIDEIDSLAARRRERRALRSLVALAGHRGAIARTALMPAIHGPGIRLHV